MKFISRRRTGGIAPRILLLIRDRRANTWDAICAECGLDPKEFHTGHAMVWHAIEELKDAGLVEFQLSQERTT